MERASSLYRYHDFCFKKSNTTENQKVLEKKVSSSLSYHLEPTLKICQTNALSQAIKIFLASSRTTTPLRQHVFDATLRIHRISNP